MSFPEILRRPTSWYVLFLLPFFVILFGTQNPIALDDGLRHMVMAGQYAGEGAKIAGDWGAYFFAGYFAEHVVDPWFLSHLVYIPFTFFVDDVVGLKVATAVFLAVLLFAASCVAKVLRLPRFLAFVFICLLLFGSSTFTERLLVGRPLVLQTALFLFVYISVLKRQFTVLAALMAVATLLSQLFVFPLLLCLVAVASFCLLHQWRTALHCFSAACTGVASGFLLHPHSAAYISYLYTIFLRIPFLHQGIGLGGEMQGGLFGDDVTLYLVIFLVFLLFILLSTHGVLQKKALYRFDILLSLSATVLLLMMYLLWARAVDFFWPTMLILAMQLSTVTPEITSDVLQHLRAPAFYLRWRFLWIHLLFLVCAVNFFELSIRTFANAPANNLQNFRAILEVPAESRLLNVDWDIFPPLVFLNSSANYARGIDPSMDGYSDPEGVALSELLLERWRWDWSDLRGSMAEVWERYEFPWSFRVLSERQDIDFPMWVENLRRHYHADFLVLKTSFHARSIFELRKVLPVFVESKAIVIFDLG